MDIIYIIYFTSWCTDTVKVLRFSDHFIANFSQNVPVKKIMKIVQYLARTWRKVCDSFLGHPVYNGAVDIQFTYCLTIQVQCSKKHNVTSITSQITQVQMKLKFVSTLEPDISQLLLGMICKVHQKSTVYLVQTDCV